MMWCSNRRVQAGESLCNVGVEYKILNFSLFNSQFVPCLRRLVPNGLPRSCTFCRAPVPLGRVVDGVALAQVFLGKYFSLPLSLLLLHFN